MLFNISNISYFPSLDNDCNKYAYLTFAVFAFTYIAMFISKKGFLGLKAKNFCSHKNLCEGFLIFFILFSFILFLINFIYILLSFLYFNESLYWLNAGEQPQESVRWWGVTQTCCVIGSAIATYILIPVNPGLKTIASLGAIFISFFIIGFCCAVENPIGFNRFMYNLLSTKNGTGLAPVKVGDKELNTATQKVAEEATKSSISESSNQLVGSNLEGFDQFKDLKLEKIFEYVLQPFKPGDVEGYLDDLLVQQLFIYFLLLMVVVSLIILLLVYIFINIFLQNKEFILSKFNNKFIRFIINYQIILGRISFYYIPIMMLFGLIELSVGLHYLITHPIGWEGLPIDLHTYISNKKA